MIIGILLGITAAISITSLLIIITSTSGILQENLITGATIGTTQLTSYATTTLAISTAVALVIILFLRNSKSNS